MSLLAQVHFVSGVVFNSFLQQPTALASLLVIVSATAAVFRLLVWKQNVATSPRLILPLLIIILGILLKSCSLQAELVASESAVEEKAWALHQSKNYRTQILQQLSTRSEIEEINTEEVYANPLDGCSHVFIDIGSNKDFGMQIRKLFEPQLFPGDPALQIYQRYFGPPETRQAGHICAVGFYPKEITDSLLLPGGASLKALVNNYSTCGIKVLVKDAMQVTKFTKEVAATRSLLPDSPKVETPRIVIGCDIDACTSEMLAEMALSGVLGLVDNIHIVGTALQYSSGNKSKMIETLVPTLTSLGKLTKQLNMEEQFTVDLIEKPEHEGTVKSPVLAC